MFVDRLELRDFRSYSKLELELNSGPNVLVGANGVGKTNVVEAIAYVSTLASHRIAHDLPLVRRDCEQAAIRLEFIQDRPPQPGATLAGSRMIAEIAIIPGRANRLQISGTAVKPRELVGQLRTVVFSPEDLDLVKGDPASRRRFLDGVLIQRAPRYLAIKSDYERVLKQRNALLKSLSKSRSSFRNTDSSSGSAADIGSDRYLLQVWDEQLAHHGSELLFGRMSLIEQLAPLMNEAYAQVAPGKPAQVSYQARSLVESGVIAPGEAIPRDREALAELIRQSIAAKAREELARGITLIGPHRDDLVLTVDQLLAKHYASHGECWSVALALKLASFNLMRDIDHAGDPVLILDDVFAELDATRRSALADFALDVDQVVITAAVGEDVPLKLAGTRYQVVAGEVTSV